MVDLSKLFGKKNTAAQPPAAPLKAPRRVVSFLEATLGKSVIGPEQWLATLGVDVGSAPPPPLSDIQRFISSPCPIHPHRKVAETHVLCLIPEKLGKAECSVRALDTLCSRRKIAEAFDIQVPEWRKKLSCVDNHPAKSEWIWVVRGFAERGYRDERSFFGRSVEEQHELFREHYPQYRQGSLLEGIAAALLLKLAHEDRLFAADYYRCGEPSSLGGKLMIKGGQLRVVDTDQPQYKAHGVGCLLVRPAEG